MLEPERANRLLDFAASSRYNRDLFLLEFREDYYHVVRLIAEFEDAWEIVARERDKQGTSHVGLLVLQGIVLRQIVYAFDSLQGSQISQVWLNVRIALETHLYMGKWVHDPATSKVWKEKEANFKLYKKVFETDLEKDNALPRAGSFRAVLKAINSEYLHPNPRLVFSPVTGGVALHPKLGMRGIETIWLGQDLSVVETHLLAFIRLFADAIDASNDLLDKLFVRSPKQAFRQHYEQTNLKRARLSASASVDARFVLMHLGAWNPTLL